MVCKPGCEGRGPGTETEVWEPPAHTFYLNHEPGWCEKGERVAAKGEII